MKTTLKAKLLQHLIAKKEDGGFTLIELLVVIIIIGILSAIALPSFLNQANRARQSEAVTYVGSVNRAQQAYRLENPTFANTIPLLGLGIQNSTEFYTYAVIGASATQAGVTATPTDPVLLGYTGAAYTTTDGGGNSTTTALLCKGTPGNTPTCGPITP
jgi:type IV pilus assembly protein PilA